MKTIRMLRDHDVPLTPRSTAFYRGGRTYERVPEFQARHILEAGAGEDVTPAKTLESRAFPIEQIAKTFAVPVSRESAETARPPRRRKGRA
jgi:hypothetical protein